jgi:hypothetical protein
MAKALGVQDNIKIRKDCALAGKEAEAESMLIWRKR